MENIIILISKIFTSMEDRKTTWENEGKEESDDYFQYVPYGDLDDRHLASFIAILLKSTPNFPTSYSITLKT